LKAHTLVLITGISIRKTARGSLLNTSYAPKLMANKADFIWHIMLFIYLVSDLRTICSL